MDGSIRSSWEMMSVLIPDMSLGFQANSSLYSFKREVARCAPSFTNCLSRPRFALQLVQVELYPQAGRPMFRWLDTLFGSSYKGNLHNTAAKMIDRPRLFWWGKYNTSSQQMEKHHLEHNAQCHQSREGLLGIQQWKKANEKMHAQVLIVLKRIITPRKVTHNVQVHVHSSIAQCIWIIK